MTRPKNHRRYLSVIAIVIFVGLLFAYFYVGIADSNNNIALKIGLILGALVSALTAFNLIRQELEAHLEKDTLFMISRVHSDAKGHPNCFWVDDEVSNRYLSQYELHYCERPDELELYIPLMIPGEEDVVFSPFVFEFILEGNSNVEKLSFNNISIQIRSAEGQILLPYKDFYSNVATVTRNMPISEVPRLNLLLGVNRKYKKMDTLVEIKMNVENTNKAGHTHKDTLYAKVRWHNGNVTLMGN